MYEIRNRIKEYYNNHVKENPNAHIPKFLHIDTYTKLINKKMKPRTLDNWIESNKDIRNIKEYCEDNKNKIPLNELNKILGNDILAQKYNEFQNFLFNWYENKKNDVVDDKKREELLNYYSNLPTINKEVEKQIEGIKETEHKNELDKLKNDKDKQIEQILRDKDISDGLNEEEKEDIKKQSAEENEKIKKQASKKIEKMTAKIKNKKDDKIRELQEELDELKFKPTLKKYVDDKVKNSSYSLDKDQLINVIKKDIEDNKLPKKTDAEQLYNDIKRTATEYIIKNLNRIKKLSVLTGYNNDLFNKLPPEVATIVQEEMNNKIQEDIRKKNIKYILPKDLPRWERATQQHNVNPMLGRGAWSH